jgi:hypothetical protein
MQRWILLGVVAMILVVGGGGFAFWTYRQNRPTPVWVPILVNRELDPARHEEISKDLKTKLMTPEFLLQVSKELQLASKWQLPSDQAAAAEIAKRLFVRVGEADTPDGKAPSINVGLDGPKKDFALSREIAMRIIKDVWKILGVKPPPGS